MVKIEIIEKFELIIGEMKEMLRTNKLIGNKLIEYFDDEEFYNFVNSRAEQILKRNISKGFVTIDEKYDVIISLSYIALKLYTGNYWDNVRAIYNDLYSDDDVKPQKIRSMIVDILKDFRGEDKRYIEFPIKNAIVPYAFIDKYYDFMFDIYQLNFKSSLPDNVEEEIRYVFNAIYEKINADSDELNIEVTNKTYKLIKSTQNIIKNEENLSELCELSARILERIQAYMWNLNSKLELNTYFNTSFNRFLQFGTGKRRLTESEKKEYVSRWKPSIKLINDDIYLTTPVHKVPEKYDPKQIYITVYNDDKLIYIEEKPVVEQSIGYYTVDPKNIRVANPLGNLSYKICAGNEEIYNSQTTLHRNFILFNEDGNEIKTDSNYEGNCSIVYQDLNDNGIEIRTRREFYNVGEITVKQGNYFTLDGEIITFTGKVRNSITGEKSEECIAKLDNEEVDVYTSLKCIVFNCDDIVENIGVEVNGARQKLVDKYYKISSINKSVQIDISNYKNGYYEFRIFNFVQKKDIFCQKVILDSDIDIDCKRIAKRKYIISLNSCFLDKQYDRNVDLDDGITADVTFRSQGRIISYVMTLNLPLYQIDNGKYYEFDDYLWGPDIKDNSTIKLINFSFDQLLIRDEKQKNIGEAVHFLSKQSNIAPQIIMNRNSNKEFYIYLYNSDNVRNVSLWILNSCKLIDSETFVEYDKEHEELNVSVAYKGNSSINMRLKNKNGNLVFGKEIRPNVDYITIKDLFTNVEYTLQFYEVRHTSMFFSSEIIIGEKHIFFMKCSDLIGRYCRINSIRVDDRKKNIIDKEILLNNFYVQFNELVNNNVYIGEIYKMQAGIKHTFSSVNPVKIEILSKNLDSVVNCIITTQDDDGLLYDSINREFSYDGNNSCVLVNDYDIALLKRRD